MNIESWLKEHKDDLGKYQGRYIVVGPSGLIGVADTLEEARGLGEDTGSLYSIAQIEAFYFGRWWVNMDMETPLPYAIGV